MLRRCVGRLTGTLDDLASSGCQWGRVEPVAELLDGQRLEHSCPVDTGGVSPACRCGWFLVVPWLRRFGCHEVFHE